MLSLRSCLFGLYPIIAVVMVIATNRSVTTVPSNDWRDLTVQGEGHFCTAEGLGKIQYGSVQFAWASMLMTFYVRSSMGSTVRWNRGGFERCSSQSIELPSPPITVQSLQLKQPMTAERPFHFAIVWLAFFPSSRALYCSDPKSFRRSFTQTMNAKSLWKSVVFFV